MSLKHLWDDAKNRQDTGLPLFVMPQHVKWLELPEKERVYSAKAIAFRGKAEAEIEIQARSGRFSPSSIGKCERRLVFGFAGAPSIEPPLDVIEQSELGKVLHLRWQMEGLTQGWLSEAEVWAHDGHRLGGTMDGICADESIFECKTVHPYKYSKIVLQDRCPPWENRLQVQAYFRITGREYASIVYQDRGGGSSHEFRVRSDPAVEDQLDEIIDRLNGYVDINRLPERLADCEMGTGRVYHQCPFRDHCLSTGAVLDDSRS